jgi:hypothetical protein
LEGRRGKEKRENFHLISFESVFAENGEKMVMINIF